mgnify:CR=1 FL=1
MNDNPEGGSLKERGGIYDQSERWLPTANNLCDIVQLTRELCFKVPYLIWFKLIHPAHSKRPTSLKILLSSDGALEILLWFLNDVKDVVGIHISRI